jgi:hypothetical protein
MNAVTLLRAGAGRQDILFSKAEQSGVEVRLLYTGGFSLAMAKPVYLNVLYPTAFEGEYDLVIEKYDPDKHYIDNIYGRAPFTYGISETRPYPGAYVKAGLLFEYGSFNSAIRCLELGVTADVFAKEIPIMAYAENSAVYLNFYINWVFGRRW